MRKGIAYGLLACVLLILAGCSSKDKDINTALIKENVEYNKKMYTESKEASKGLESVVAHYLSTGSFTDISSYSTALKSDIEISLPLVVEAIAKRTNYLEVSDEFKNENNVKVTDYISPERFTEETLYLLDDTTGLVEQFFLFRLVDGTTAGITFKWLGGNYVDVETLHMD